MSNPPRPGRLPRVCAAPSLAFAPADRRQRPAAPAESAARAAPWGRLDLHATRERDKKIAKGMGKAFTRAKKGSGTQRARKAQRKT